MNGFPTLSIIIPVYNVEQYLPKCIDSVLTQSFSDFELILVDDGSTDGSGRICDDYAQKDSCIKAVHKQNGGQVRQGIPGLILRVDGIFRLLILTII